MITLGLGLQDTDSVPEEIAKWVEEKNSKYPNITFKIDKRIPTTEEIETENREFAEKYQVVFTGFHGDAKEKGVSGVSFLYGKESWSVKLVGSVNGKDEIHDPYSAPKEGEVMKPLPAELRNEIVGFDPNKLERIEIKGREDRGTKDSVVYGESRLTENPLQEHAQALREVDIEGRDTSAFSLSGKELKEVVKDPDRFEAAVKLLSDFKEGKKPN
jgi:hypothetical protein